MENLTSQPIAETEPVAPPPTGEQPTSATEPQARGKPWNAGSYTWIESRVIDTILHKFQGTQASYGLAVYVILARKSALRKGCPKMQLPIAEIAFSVALSYRKASNVLKLLEFHKLISIERGKRVYGQVELPPSTYTLLQLGKQRVPKSTKYTSESAPQSLTSHAENPIQYVLLHAASVKKQHAGCIIHKDISHHLGDAPPQSRGQGRRRVNKPAGCASSSPSQIKSPSL